MKTAHIKIYLILIFITGLLQIDILHVEWDYFKYIQAIHIIGSILLTIFLLIPLVNIHVYRHLVVKKQNSINGIVLGVVLFLITISGFYLFLIGNRGGDIYGLVSFYIHLYGSFFLLLALFLHTKKKSQRGIYFKAYGYIDSRYFLLYSFF